MCKGDFSLVSEAKDYGSMVLAHRGMAMPRFIGSC